MWFRQRDLPLDLQLSFVCKLPLPVAAVHPSPLPRLFTLYSQVSLKAEPSFGPAPNSTITPRWLSKAIVALL